MSMLVQDIRFGLRSLMRDRLFTIMVVITLALGIGANTAIFSLVNGILLRPLPYPQAERIVQLLVSDGEGTARSASALNFDFWTKRTHAYESISALNGMVVGYNLAGAAGSEVQSIRVSGYLITSDYFKVLGVAPAQGRSFLNEEDDPGAAPVVILSHAIWQRHFNSDSGLIGGMIELNDMPHTVVGVMPEGFSTYPEADLWTPLPYEQEVGSASYNYQVYGRLKDGMSLALAQADADRMAEEYLAAYPERVGQGDAGVVVERFQEIVVGDTRFPLLVLSAAVGLVLLIACANVAHLLLARSKDRVRELAVRLALGATRGRLIRQLLTESLLLATIGGLGGLLLAQWGIDALITLVPDDLPRLEEVGIDGRVLLFTLGLSVLTGLLFGLIPALKSFSLDVNNSLKEGAGQGSIRGRTQFTRSILVSSEVALSLILLIGAGLLLQTFYRLTTVDPGFNPHSVLTAQLSMTGDSYTTTRQLAIYQQRLEQKLSMLPGVQHVATSSNLPLEKPLNLPIFLEGWQDRMRAVEYRLISPRYFQVMGIPLHSGRSFEESDQPGAPPVVIVNEAFARQFFPESIPIGQSLTVGHVKDTTRDIVGVVGDVREFGLQADTPATIYIPLAQAPDQVTNLVNSFLPLHVLLRTEGDPMQLTSALRQVAKDIDPMVPIANIRSMSQVLASSIAEQRFRLLLIGVFAVFALLLSAIGLYGVTSYTVAQRTREIGVRLALGANPSVILRLIVFQGVRLTIYGILVGMIVAFGLTRFIVSLLYEVSPTDPFTYVGIAFLMIGVAAIASYLPARRAALIDPMKSLRTD